jgi:uncharacterized protein YjbJ (UPF0337 family)
VDESKGCLADRVVGKAKAWAGAAVGNDDLRREGQLKQAKAEAADEAAESEELAAQRQAEAEVVARRAAQERRIAAALDGAVANSAESAGTS